MGVLWVYVNVLRLLLWLGARGHRVLTFYDIYTYVYITTSSITVYALYTCILRLLDLIHSVETQRASRPPQTCVGEPNPVLVKMGRKAFMPLLTLPTTQHTFGASCVWSWSGGREQWVVLLLCVIGRPSGVFNIPSKEND